MAGYFSGDVAISVEGLQCVRKYSYRFIDLGREHENIGLRLVYNGRECTVPFETVEKRDAAFDVLSKILAAG